MDTSTSKLFRVKATRSAPPGFGSRQDRQGTYDAALTQFEELLEAARRAGPASRPLPLFYALSQAGRAISAAARAEPGPWKLRGHGLKAPDLDQPLTALLIKNAGAKEVTPEMSVVDSFTGVATLFGGEPIRTDVTLGEVWTSTPEVQHLLPYADASAYRRPASLVVDDPGGFATPMFPWGRVDAVVVGLGVDGDDVIETLTEYLPPSAPVPHLFAMQGLQPIAEETALGYGYKISFPADAPNYEGHARTVARISPAADGFKPLTLMPKIGDAHVSRIGRWWLLLYGLSMVARYEPGRWALTLDLSASTLAAPVEELLQVAVETLPDLVWEALSWSRNDVHPSK